MAMLKFLPGVLIVQAATVAMVIAVMSVAHGLELWIPLIVFAGVIAVLVAFWFGSIAEHVKKDAVSQASDRHARDREALLVTAESDKRSALEETHRRLIREAMQARTQANVKLGLGFLGLLSVGGIMLAVQFMTFGLLVMSAAGGALGGYLLRAKQERLPGGSTPDTKLLESRYSLELPSKEKRGFFGRL